MSPDLTNWQLIWPCPCHPPKCFLCLHFKYDIEYEPSKTDKIRWEWRLLAEEHRMALMLDRQLTGARGLAIWSSSPLMSFIYFFCIFAPWHVLFEDFPRDWFYYYFIKENASTLKLEATSAPVPCRTTNQTSCRSLMPERRFMRSQLAHLQHQHRKNAAQPW